MEKQQIADLRKQQREAERAAQAALRRGEVMHAAKFMAKAKDLAVDVLAIEAKLLGDAIRAINALPPLPALPKIERNGALTC